MAAPRQLKRLRVRLRTSDPEELARDFGRFLRANGLFLPCPERLPPQTPVRFLLLYVDGRVALEGRGYVERCEIRPVAGLELALKWTPTSRALVAWCAAEPRPVLNPSSLSLVEDLAPPSEKAPIPVPWVDEDEPLVLQEGPEGYGSALSADVLDDEPLAMGDEKAPALQAPDPDEWDEDSPPPSSDDFLVLDASQLVMPPAEHHRDEPVTVVDRAPADEAASVLILPPDINPDREAEATVDPRAVTIVDRIEGLEPPEGRVDPMILEPAELYPSGTIEIPVGLDTAPSSALDRLVRDVQRAALDDPAEAPTTSGPAMSAAPAPNGRPPAQSVVRPSPKAPSRPSVPAHVAAPPAGAPTVKPPVATLSPTDRPPASPSAVDDRAPGEVTPLARIALVRRRTDSDAHEEEGVPATAIPSKRHRSGLPGKGARVVGIDPGTAKTAMAAIVEGRPRLLPSRTGTRVIPSVVVIENSGRTFVGEAAARKLPWYPKLGIAGPGRLLGLVAGGPQATARASEVICNLGPGDESEVAASFGPHTVSIEEVVALLLKEVRASVTSGLQEPVNRAVLTCPTFFGYRQRQALRVAAELAGFHVERIVSAPLAAAVDLVAGRPRSGRVMIVDCGAGALDVGLVEMTSQGMTLVAARGDRSLGGDAYDQLLVRHLASLTGNLDGVTGLGGYFDIREAAELGKWTLSEQENAHVAVDHPGDDTTGPAWHVSADIRRGESDDLFLPLVERSIALCRQVCDEAGWPIGSLDCVVPIGGQSRIPILSSRLREAFGSAVTSVDPQTSVPFGAAQIAQRIADDVPLALNEIVPHSLCMGLAGGGLDRLIARGAALPTTASRTIRVVESSDLNLFLFEGDGQEVSQVEPLTRLTLMDVPGEVEMPFDVRFSVEAAADGTLRFEAVDVETQKPLTVMTNATVTPAAIRWHLKMPSAATPAEQDDNVFAWLRRRLERAENARGGEPSHP